MRPSLFFLQEAALAAGMRRCFSFLLEAWEAWEACRLELCSRLECKRLQGESLFCVFVFLCLLFVFVLFLGAKLACAPD
jgi:hypothetical protein